MTQKNTNAWTFDVRVRERNLKSGALDDKDVEKYLSQLPDVADQAEPFATYQPALAQPEPPPVLVDDEAVEEEEEAESFPEEPAIVEAPDGSGTVV